MSVECQTIINQLGGVPKLRLMLGCQVAIDQSTSSVILSKIKGCRKANFVKVSLLNDLYDIRFFKINERKFDLKVVGEELGIGVENLKRVIESRLGLALSIR